MAAGGAPGVDGSAAPAVASTSAGQDDVSTVNATPAVAFASAGQEDVSTINAEGQPMHVEAALPAAAAVAGDVPDPVTHPSSAAAGGEPMQIDAAPDGAAIAVGEPNAVTGPNHATKDGAAPALAPGETATAFVKNLPHGCGEGELAAVLEGATEVRLVRDRTTSRLKARGPTLQSCL